MNTKQENITLFEHQTVKLEQVIGEVKFDRSKLNALQEYYGIRGVPYFSLIHNGIKFNEYVGVIQVGGLIIEVLPKADESYKGADEKDHWRDILINMIRSVGAFDIHAPSSSSLKLKSNSLLYLYFELFINEVEYLIRNGLLKQYRKKEGNVNALKGNLLFSDHIQLNLTHQERFFVRHTIYDVEHILHIIIYKTIQLLYQINTHIKLHSRIGSLLLDFPVMPDIRVSESTFNKIRYNRKSMVYQKAIEIARLLLLNYHPDIKKGRNHVLALMFDMNKLWEQFVYVSLRQKKEAATTIIAQTSKYFWKPQEGKRSIIKPDIVLNKGKVDCVVLDTKWKILNGYNPSPEDLRQMYVYHEYYRAKKVALIYPGSENQLSGGTFLDPITGDKLDKECSIITLSVESNIKNWQGIIYDYINSWIKSPAMKH